MEFKWKNKKRKAPPPPNPFSGEVEEYPDESVIDDGEDLSAQDMIDFSPVYRCLHIHTVLVCMAIFSLGFSVLHAEFFTSSCKIYGS